MHDEPKSSVRYRSSCLRSEVRSFSYATWHSIIPLESGCGVGFYLYIFIGNFDVKRSRLSMYDEPKSSVRYRSICLRSEVRFFYMLTALFIYCSLPSQSVSQVSVSF